MRHAIFSGALAIALIGCTEGADTGDTTEAASTDAASVEMAETPAPAEAAVQPIPLALSINDVMVAMVDFAADGVWRPPAMDEPMTERDWLLAEQDAKNLIAASTLITMAGTGANDEEWVTHPDWRRWAADMLETSQQALSAVEAKDQERLLLVGDRLVEICQECHQQYKPGLPSMGVTRFPIYPKRAEE